MKRSTKVVEFVSLTIISIGAVRTMERNYGLGARGANSSSHGIAAESLVANQGAGFEPIQQDLGASYTVPFARCRMQSNWEALAIDCDAYSVTEVVMGISQRLGVICYLAITAFWWARRIVESVAYLDAEPLHQKLNRRYT